jgi:hypothetical protein
MKSPIRADIRAAIARLAAAESYEDSAIREAAIATNALPVHSDISGVLAVTSDGDVLHFDFETRMTTAPDERWRIYALAKASRRFPELKDLAPSMPRDATTCPACEGRGVLLGDMDCGTCMGLGWISSGD